jgi:hypothetical protein
MSVKKVIRTKNLNNFLPPAILNVKDENIRIRIQDPDPDALVRGMDPRILIRIHQKMSWFRNTVLWCRSGFGSGLNVIIDLEDS